MFLSGRLLLPQPGTHRAGTTLRPRRIALGDSLMRKLPGHCPNRSTRPAHLDPRSAFHPASIPAKMGSILSPPAPSWHPACLVEIFEGHCIQIIHLHHIIISSYLCAQDNYLIIVKLKINPGYRPKFRVTQIGEEIHPYSR